MQPPTLNFWYLTYEHPWVLARDNTVPFLPRKLSINLLLHLFSTADVGGFKMHSGPVRPTWHVCCSHQSLRERRDEGHDHCHWYVGATNQIVD